jgi:hypothetical protein
MGQTLRGNLDHHKQAKESASLFKDLETDLYGAPEPKQSMPMRALSAIGLGPRTTPEAAGPAAQGLGGQPEPKQLGFDELAALHQKYSLRAAKDPELYKQAAPMLEQIKSRALQEYAGGFQGDTTTLEGALDYGEYLGRGAARFGEMPDPTKTVQRAATAERVGISRDNQQSQAQSRSIRDQVYAADRQDAARSRAERDATYRDSVTMRAGTAGGSQDPLKAQQQDVRQQQAIFDLLHTDPDRAFQMAADLYGVEFKSVVETEVPGPNGQPVRAIQFEMWQDGKMVGTSNTFEESVRLGRTRAALEGGLDAEGNPATPKATGAPKADTVTRTYRESFTKAWTEDPDDTQLDLFKLGEAYALELKQQGLSDHEAAARAKERVITVNEKLEGMKNRGLAKPGLNVRSLWDAEGGRMATPSADEEEVSAADAYYEKVFGKR